MPQRRSPVDHADREGREQSPGPNMAVFRHLLRLRRQFRAINGFEPEGYVCVPSRVNLLGEHVDYLPREYLQARVLPFAASEYGMFVAFAARQDTLVLADSMHPEFEAGHFDVAEAPKGEDWLHYLTRTGVPDKHWMNYILGSYCYLQNENPDSQIRGARLLVDSNIPIASGASSSSALTVASGLAARITNGLFGHELSAEDRSELGRASAEAEWYVGTRGGRMDQQTISSGESGKALSIRFQPFGVTPVDVPGGYCCVTFFTTHHAGGSQLTSEYNERSSVSRFVIPAALDAVLQERPELHEEWRAFQQAVQADDLCAIEALSGSVETILGLLPESLTLGEISDAYPGAYARIEEEKGGAYAPLFEHKQDVPLKIRDRSRHHVADIVRVIRAERLLAEAAQAQRDGNPSLCDARMTDVGALMNEAHASLRDLYGLSTDEIEEVVRLVDDLASTMPGIKGRRLMGGGFGGNVVVLVAEDTVDELTQAVDERYYEAHGRDADAEGAITVCTAGDGATHVSAEAVAAAQLVQLLGQPLDIAANRAEINALLDELWQPRPVMPVVVAAGQGTRYAESLREAGVAPHPKVIAEVDGKPVVQHIVDSLLSLRSDGRMQLEKPVIVVSDFTEMAVREALTDYEDRVEYVTQEPVAGTGHAVLQVRQTHADFDGDLLVRHDTLLVQPRTLADCVKIHQSIEGCSMVYATAWKRDPYAPLVLDGAVVVDSMETHLEGDERIAEGADNVGAFVVRAQDAFDVLGAYDEHFTEGVGYDPEVLPKGELGFPNTMGRHLHPAGKLALSAPLADPREARGIKEYDHIRVIEGYLTEFAEEQARRPRLVARDADLQEAVKDYLAGGAFAHLFVFADISMAGGYSGAAITRETAKCFADVLETPDVYIVMLTQRSGGSLVERFLEPLAEAPMALGHSVLEPHPQLRCLSHEGIEFLMGSAPQEGELRRIRNAVRRELGAMGIGVDIEGILDRDRNIVSNDGSQILRRVGEPLADGSGKREPLNYLLIKEERMVTAALYRTLLVERSDPREALKNMLNVQGVRCFVTGRASLDAHASSKADVGEAMLAKLCNELGIGASQAGVIALSRECLPGHAGTYLLEFALKHQGLAVSTALGMGRSNADLAPAGCVLSQLPGDEATRAVLSAIVAHRGEENV